jgi:uncharacterized protein YukE
MSYSSGLLNLPEFNILYDAALTEFYDNAPIYDAYADALQQVLGELKLLDGNSIQVRNDVAQSWQGNGSAAFVDRFSSLMSQTHLLYGATHAAMVALRPLSRTIKDTVGPFIDWVHRVKVVPGAQYLILGNVPGWTDDDFVASANARLAPLYTGLDEAGRALLSLADVQWIPA